MAWDFAAEIHALSGFDADLVGTTGSTSGENLSLHTNQWLTQGAKEIINVLPSKLKSKCMTETTLNNSSTTMDLDGVGEVLYVTRLSADSGGYRISCRKVPAEHGELSGDSSNMMYYATATDPVYWLTSSSDATILNVNPTPTVNQTAIVFHVAYPTVAFDGTAIANFPDEAEYLVVLYAAIKATQYMMLSEEDPEVYSPQLQTLQQDYAKGISILKGGGTPQAAKGQE